MSAGVAAAPGLGLLAVLGLALGTPAQAQMYHLYLNCQGMVAAGPGAATPAEAGLTTRGAAAGGAPAADSDKNDKNSADADENIQARTRSVRSAAKRGNAHLELALRDNNMSMLVQRSNVLPTGQRLKYQASQTHYTATFLPQSAGAVTLSKMCGSGMRAMMFANDMLTVGSADVVVAGGMESMSNAPHLSHIRKGVKYGLSAFYDHMARAMGNEFRTNRAALQSRAGTLAYRYGLDEDAPIPWRWTIEAGQVGVSGASTVPFTATALRLSGTGRMRGALFMIWRIDIDTACLGTSSKVGNQPSPNCCWRQA